MNKDRIKFIAVIALQVVFLLFLIFSKQYTLATGTRILLKTVPVDPRSLFSGDYVTLGYDISEIDLTKVKTDIDYKNKNYISKFNSRKSSEYVYVTLSKKNGEKYWTPDSVTLSKPSVNERQVFVKSKSWYLTSYSNRFDEDYSEYRERIDKYIRITYDFSSFYVPEGMGLEIEQKVRSTDKNEVLVELSVGKDGNALLSRLLINDVPVRF